MWLKSTADFLLSQWLWNVTWGWYHIPVTMFIMMFLLKFFGRVRIMPSVLISVFSQVFSFALFSLFVVAVPVYLLGLKFVPYDCYTQEIMHPAIICLSLGVIYFLFHILFFLLLDLFYDVPLRFFILISFVANIVSALLVYKFWCFNVL